MMFLVKFMKRNELMTVCPAFLAFESKLEDHVAFWFLLNRHKLRHQDLGKLLCG